MRRFAPIIFAVLSALVMVERGINRGALAGHAPQTVDLHGIPSMAHGTDCLAKADLLQTLAMAGATIAPEAVPFETDRPDLTDWVAANETTGLRHLAFDINGCLAVWHPAP